MKKPQHANESTTIYQGFPVDAHTDLKGSFSALRRAAQRARVTAEQTGTDLIVVRDGKVVRVPPTKKPRV